jgi:AAA+ superfamily predicted ATPase
MIESIYAEALKEPKDSIFYTLGKRLREEYPDSFLLESGAGSYFFPVHYAAEGKCSIAPVERAFSEFEFSWDATEHRIITEPYNAWSELEWNGQKLQLFSISVRGQHCIEQRHFLVADTEVTATSFFAECCRWYAEVRDEILVFSEGHWSKSEELFQSIRSSCLDNIILEGELKSEIVRDFRNFFESSERYDKFKIPWKRGVLFLGSPGNGKTHMVKALVNELKLPCLYVRSFKTEYESSHTCIRRAFKRARDTAPCLLILEDLDSLVDDENRSFFLNEMDGFFANRGILTLATTNHPERLDPAILDRPSRFDRKYTFNLPAFEERVSYIRMMNLELESKLRLTDPDVETIAGATEEFSFAYLKELFLSTIMSWVNSSSDAKTIDVMTSQIETLRKQMATAQEEVPEGFSPDSSFEKFLPPGMRTIIRRFPR